MLLTGFAFADFSDATGLILLDNAAVTPENVLRVSPAEAKARGNVWFSEQQFVSVGFETTFDFRMTEGSQFGFSFIVQNESASALARQSQAPGLEMISNSLAIEFDTHLLASQGDLNDNHISVQTNGTGYNAQGSIYSLGWASPAFDLDDGGIHTARISYSPGNLSVYVDDLVNPLLTVAVDLGETLNLDLGQAWVGFGAISGDQNHEILNWEYHTLVDTSQAIGISDVSLAEGSMGTKEFLFTVTRLGDTTGTTTLDWLTSDGTAMAGVDYVAGSGQLSFAPGETERSISIAVDGDTVQEANESFFVNLTVADGSAVLADAKAAGAILNEDVSLSLGDAGAVEGSQAWRYIDQFVQPVTSRLVQPRYVIFGPDGDLYVGSRMTDDVHRFDGATGTFIDVFAKKVPGYLDDPRGIVFGPDGNLYVSSHDDRVRRYDGATGAYLDDFVTVGSSGLERAEGLAFGPDGHLYVVDRDAHKVYRFNGSNGDYIDDFIASGSGGLQFPKYLVFGPDGDLYVGSNGTNSVLRFDGATGAFIDTFVASSSGGLQAPEGVLFGSDGDLYVSSLGTHEVLRYDGTTGAFIEVVASQANGGLNRPQGLAFDADGLLHVVSRLDDGVDARDPILRYGTESLAVFTVSLSAPAGVPVTVNYSTGNGTATAGSDYTAVSGTLTFAPGETSRTILVQTINNAVHEANETFTVTLSNASPGAAIVDGTGVGTIADDDPPPPQTKFYVVDAGSDRTYEYTEAGQSVENYGLGSGNINARGVASEASGQRVWVIDDNDFVYVYNAAGTLLGSWKANGLSTPEGIASNGTDIWIVDRGSDKVFRYAGAASRTSGTMNATSNFSLHNQNKDAMGIETNGTHFWIVNNSSTDKVFKYTLSGSHLGNWTLQGGVTNPTGITLDPTNPSHIWIVDATADKVFQYTAAANRVSGSQSASSSYHLAAGNTNPQGIADPPPESAMASVPASNPDSSQGTTPVLGNLSTNPLDIFIPLTMSSAFQSSEESQSFGSPVRSATRKLLEPSRLGNASTAKPKTEPSSAEEWAVSPATNADDAELDRQLALIFSGDLLSEMWAL